MRSWFVVQECLWCGWCALLRRCQNGSDVRIRAWVQRGLRYCAYDALDAVLMMVYGAGGARILSQRGAHHLLVDPDHCLCWSAAFSFSLATTLDALGHPRSLSTPRRANRSCSGKYVILCYTLRKSYVFELYFFWFKFPLLERKFYK
jgi:hypothetical protein